MRNNKMCLKQINLQNDTLFLSEGKSAMNYWRILNCAYKSAISSCIKCAIY